MGSQPQRFVFDRRTFVLSVAATTLVGCTSGSPSPDRAGSGDGSSTTSVATGSVAGAGRNGPADRTRRFQSRYVEMRDGVRIAVDLWLPSQAANAPVPTVIRATRYHRAMNTGSADPDNNSNRPEADRWAERGYGLVVVDARGSGASFGTRETELSPTEIDDYDEILTWIGTQAWSNGRVGSYGVSYDGTTAELMARTGNPYLTAIAPQFSDFDVYRQLVYPGGVYLGPLFDRWLDTTQALDGVEGANERLAEAFGVGPDDVEGLLGTVAPVEGDDGTLLAAAIEDHQTNVRLADQLPSLPFRDSPEWQAQLVQTHQAAIEASAVPIFVQAGWYDAGTATGALERFASFSNPQEVWIGPWSHGGQSIVEPFGTRDSDGDDLSSSDQFERLAAFFDRHVAADRAPEASVLHFSTSNAQGWTSDAAWPTAEFSSWPLFLGETTLGREPGSRSGWIGLPAEESRSGETSRWQMNLTGDPADYSSFEGAVPSRLAFTSEPLPERVWLCGFAAVDLRVRTPATDGALHVYLEAIAPNGEESYLTEGVLRLIHAAERPQLEPGLPAPRSFAGPDSRLDAADGVDVAMPLLPFSAVLDPGSHVRLSVARSDLDNFTRYDDPAVPIDIAVGAASSLTLPVRAE